MVVNNGILNNGIFNDVVLKNISEGKCKEIGKYLINTGLGDNIVVSWDHEKNSCEFTFDGIGNLDFNIYNSNVGNISIVRTSVDTNHLFDSNINYIDVDASEVEECNIDFSHVGYLMLDDVNITELLDFRDTKASEVRGQVEKL